MKKVDIVSDGCVSELSIVENFIRLARYSEEIEFLVKETLYDFADNLEVADYVILDTCECTGPKVENCFETIEDLARFKKNVPNLKLIVVGCLTKNKDFLKWIKDVYIDNYYIVEGKDWSFGALNHIIDNKYEFDDFDKALNRTHFLGSPANIQIQLVNGCTNRCSFCKTNYSHDCSVKSFPYDEALEYIRFMADEIGTRFVTLDGENATLFGIDTHGKPMLHHFIRDVSKISNIKRISVHDFTIQNMYPELLDEFITNGKVNNVCPQIETFSERLLKLNNRNHTLKDFDEIRELLQKAGKNIGTVLMSGLPTETIEDVEFSADYAKKHLIYVAQINQYVDYSKIPSSKLEQLSPKEKQLHTTILKNRVKTSNMKFFEHYMDKCDLMLECHQKGMHIFETGIAGIVAISGNSKYDNLSPGDLIQDKPKRLIKNSKIIGGPAYKL